LANQRVTTLSADLAPLQNAVHVVGGAYATSADTIALQSGSASIWSAGAGALECLISLDGLNPVMGLSLLHGDPLSQPVIQLNQTGVQVSAGAPNAGPR